MIPTTMAQAQYLVTRAPGRTAHAYSYMLRRPGERATWQRVYSAFSRAVKHGMIKAAPGPRKGQTIYVPVEED